MSTKYEGQMVWITCASTACHTRFGIDEDVDARLRKSHESFYCPFGHSQVYSQKTDAEILRERLTVKDRTIANLENEIRGLKRKPRRKKTS